MEPPDILCFTTYSPGLRNVLNNQVRLSKPHVDPKEAIEMKEYVAIWDTGATNTAITSRVVQECDLKPTGMARVSTGRGDHDSYTYLVDILLPNGVGVQNVVVSEAIINRGEVLIGMDIMTLGDFAVTNKEKKTVFTFRVPSMECIDFVEEYKKKNEPGRNQPCPCGSNKKYKHCCGK